MFKILNVITIIVVYKNRIIYITIRIVGRTDVGFRQLNARAYVCSTRMMIGRVWSTEQNILSIKHAIIVLRDTAGYS